MVPGHTRVTFKGTFGALTAPVEDWSFRLNFAPPVDTNRGTGLCDDAWQAYLDNFSEFLPPTVVLREVKVAQIGPDGKYSADPFVKTYGLQGGGPAAVHPYQVALAISLNTAARGAKGRGRFYLPASAAPIVPATGTLSDTDRAFYGTRATAFLNDMQDIVGLGRLVVASQSGSLFPVLSIRVGATLDTIRSRRTAIDERYSGDGVHGLTVIPS